MNSLERELRLAAQLYYQDGSSFLTDQEFDKKADKLKSEDPDNLIFKEPSWGYSIDRDSTPGKRCPHRYGRITGLGKAYEYSDIPKDFRVPNLYAMPKLDGMSVAMYYENSRLVQALTRGNYDEGIDVTDKVRLIVGDRLLTEYFTGGTRGEIIMSKENYDKYCLDHEDAKNARNAVAGIINSKDITEDLKYLDVVVYTVLADEAQKIESVHDVGWHSNNIGFLESQYFLETNYEHYAPATLLTYLDQSTTIPKCENMFNHFIETYPYEVDGVVVSMPTISIDRNGIFDYKEIAIKFRSETAETKVTGIDWQMSKTHYAIPVINVEPVELDGATITKCSGFHAHYIKEMDIKPGTTVEIERHGQVIPYVNKVIENVDRPSSIISKCPECGELLEWDGCHLKCNNLYCGNAILQDLMIWLNNIAPLDNFGDKLRIKFLQKYLNSNLSVESVMESKDLIGMCNLYKEMSPSPLVSKQLLLFSEMCDKLFMQPVTMVNALRALNIPRLGDKTSEKLAINFELVNKIYEASLSANIEDDDSTVVVDSELVDELREYLGAANGVSIISNIHKFSRLKYIYSRIVTVVEDAVTSNGRVAITGKLSVKRSDFEKELKSHGWMVGEITKDTDYLITDNPNSSSSKNKKADQLGIIKITESEFRSKYF